MKLMLVEQECKDQYKTIQQYSAEVQTMEERLLQQKRKQDSDFQHSVDEKASLSKRVASLTAEVKQLTDENTERAKHFIELKQAKYSIAQLETSVKSLEGQLQVKLEE